MPVTPIAPSMLLTLIPSKWDGLWHIHLLTIRRAGEFASLLESLIGSLIETIELFQTFEKCPEIENLIGKLLGVCLHGGYRCHRSQSDRRHTRRGRQIVERHTSRETRSSRDTLAERLGRQRDSLARRHVSQETHSSRDTLAKETPQERLAKKCKRIRIDRESISNSIWSDKRWLESWNI